MNNINPDEIRKTVNMFFGNGELFEVRILGCTLKTDMITDEYTLSGYFNNVDKVIEQLERLRTARGIYFTFNSIDSSQIRQIGDSYIANTLFPAYSGSTTKDSYIIKYDHIVIDFDPMRPADTSSSKEEVELSLKLAKLVRVKLKEFGFGEPAIAISGNGGHLIYKADIKIEDKNYVKHLLEYLADKFKNSKIEIDTTLHNPSRITKLYGTKTRKGVETKDRPHRFSSIKKIPDSFITITKELIVKFAGEPSIIEKKKFERKEYIRDDGNISDKFDLESFFSQYNISVHSTKNEVTNDCTSTLYNLFECPFGSEHESGKDGAKHSCIIQAEDGEDAGKIWFKCFHNSCSDKTWRDFRGLYDSSYEENRCMYEELKDLPDSIEVPAPKEVSVSTEKEFEDLPDPDSFVKVEAVEKVEKVEEESSSEELEEPIPDYDDVQLAAIDGTYIGEMVEFIRNFTTPVSPVQIPLAKALVLASAAMCGQRTYPKEGWLAADFAKVRIYSTAIAQTVSIQALMVANKGTGKDIFPQDMYAKRVDIPTCQMVSSSGAMLDLCAKSPNVLIYFSELQKIFTKSDASAGILNIIKELFAKYSYTQVMSARENKRLKMDDRILKYCSPTLLAGIQPNSVSRKINSESIDDGLLERFLIFYVKEAKSIYSPNFVENDGDFLNILKHYQSLEGDFYLKGEHREQFTLIMDELTNGMDPTYKVEERYVNIYGPRLAINLAAGLNPSPEIWHRTKILLKMFAQNYRNVFEHIYEDERTASAELKLDSLLGGIERKHLRTRKPVTKKYICNLRVYANVKDTLNTLYMLETRGDIKWNKMKNTITPTYRKKTSIVIQKADFKDVEKPVLNIPSTEIEMPTTTFTNSNSVVTLSNVSGELTEQDLKKIADDNWLGECDEQDTDKLF